MTRRNHPAWLRRRRRGARVPLMAEALATAMANRDADGIRSLLDPDAVLVIDSGGHGTAPTSPVSGADAATRELQRLMTPGTSATTASINSAPGFILVREGQVVAAVTADARAGAVSEIWVVYNPEKLRHWSARRG